MKQEEERIKKQEEEEKLKEETGKKKLEYDESKMKGQEEIDLTDKDAEIEGEQLNITLPELEVIKREKPDIALVSISDVSLMG